MNFSVPSLLTIAAVRRFTFTISRPTEQDYQQLEAELKRRVGTHNVRYAICGMTTDAAGLPCLHGFIHNTHPRHLTQMHAIPGLAVARIEQVMQQPERLVAKCRTYDRLLECGMHTKVPRFSDGDFIGDALSHRRPRTEDDTPQPRAKKPRCDPFDLKDGFADACRDALATGSLVCVSRSLIARRRYDFEVFARKHFAPFEGVREVVWVCGDGDASAVARETTEGMGIPFYIKTTPRDNYDHYRCETVVLLDHWDAHDPNLAAMLGGEPHRVETSINSFPWMARVIVVVAKQRPPHSLAHLITQVIDAAPTCCESHSYVVARQLMEVGPLTPVVELA